MIRVAVISDTHDILKTQVIDVIKSCNAVIHAGDFAKESVLDELRSLCDVYVVRGNNDGSWAAYLKDAIRFEIGGVRFFLTHDKRHVDRHLDDTDVVIFGHSHKYFQQEIDGRLWLNPGACGRPRFGGELSMAVMKIREGCGILSVEKIEVL